MHKYNNLYKVMTNKSKENLFLNKIYNKLKGTLSILKVMYVAPYNYKNIYQVNITIIFKLFCINNRKKDK